MRIMQNKEGSCFSVDKVFWVLFYIINFIDNFKIYIDWMQFNNRIILIYDKIKGYKLISHTHLISYKIVLNGYWFVSD